MFSEVATFFFVRPMGLAILGLVALIYYFLTRKFDTFAKQGVGYIKPWPLLGSMSPVLLCQQDFFEFYRNSYRRFPNSRFFGMFEFRDPVYFIRDPDLIKQLTVKDFDHFMNHRLDLDPHLDPIFANSLNLVKGQRWREMRSTMSPAFTASKMKMMFGLLRDCCERTMTHLLDAEGMRGGGERVEDIKEFFKRLTNDCFATSVFGLEVNTFKDGENDFYRNGTIISDFTSWWMTTKFFLYITMPRVMKFLKFSFLDLKSSKFFRQIMMDTFSYREKSKITRPDLVHLLLQAKHKGSIQDDSDDVNNNEDEIHQNGNGNWSPKAKKEWTDDELVAQGVIFFLAGFETTASLFSFMAYELALNPDIQRRLQQEIDETARALDGEPITYEAMQAMKYLDMCINETLRKWPPQPSVDRMCNKTYTMTDHDGRKVTLNPGDGVVFPMIGLQWDPKYFPEPERFDPERFAPERRHSIDAFTNFAFGLGQRTCIGNRYSMMQAKCIYYSLLRNFSIETCERTQIPLRLRKNNFITNPEKNIWLKLKARK